jgi:hypothetical protein
MNDPAVLGAVLRGVVSLGVLLLGSGVAARLCHSAKSWLVAAALYGGAFAWLMWGVVPQPSEQGLLYSIQWGVFGSAAYASWRASRERAPGPDDEVSTPEPTEPPAA